MKNNENSNEKTMKHKEKIEKNNEKIKTIDHETKK
jgi:hypothetical protein